MICLINKKTPHQHCGKVRNCYFWLFLGFFHKFLTHNYAHNRSHHQASRPTAGVAQAVQALDAGVEVLVHLDPIGVEFQLRRI